MSHNWEKLYFEGRLDPIAEKQRVEAYHMLFQSEEQHPDLYKHYMDKIEMLEKKKADAEAAAAEEMEKAAALKEARMKHAEEVKVEKVEEVEEEVEDITEEVGSLTEEAIEEMSLEEVDALLEEHGIKVHHKAGLDKRKAALLAFLFE